MVGGVAAAIGSLLAATFAMQLWHANLHVPFTYGSDALLTEMLIKPVISGGWVWTNHALGAPFGTQFYDFPVATDNLNWLAMRLIGLGTSDPAKVMNLFFLLGFPVNGVAGYAVLRWLRISIASSVVCAILFAVAPYHFLQGETHLLLSSYAVVPIGCYLILSVLGGSNVVGRRRDPGVTGVRTWLSKRNVFTIVLCIMIGSLGIYYATFTVLLVGGAGIAAGLGRRSFGPPVQAVVVIVAIGAMVFINDLPSIVYTEQHGRNPVAARRLPLESELYSLDLADLVLPVEGDRIGPLNSLRFKYDSTTPVPSVTSDPLGIIATLGFLWLLCLALATVAGVGRETESLSRHRQLSFLAVLAFLIGTFGGISALIGYLITPQIRGWDRISIFISFFAIAAVGLALDAFSRRLSSRHRAWAFAMLGVVLVAGVIDQSTRLAIPPYAANQASYTSDGSFVARIEKIVPKGAAIFELPYVPFPENPPVVRMTDYELGRGYVQSNDLRWSYGQMKGRAQDWAAEAQSLPLPTLLDGIVAAGFSGIWIDRFGYQDNGAAIERSIRALIGTDPIQSSDGQLLFFNLAPFAAHLRATVPAYELSALGNAILHPVGADWEAGFYTDESGSRWATPAAIASIDNTSGATIRMAFYANVFSAAPGSWAFTVTAPDGSVHRFRIGPAAKPILVLFNDPPGVHPLLFDSTAPIAHPDGDSRNLAVRYDDLIAANAALAPFLISSDSARR